ncbi:MAG: methyltransferase family protein [Chitinophagaceae bacterium]
MKTNPNHPAVYIPPPLIGLVIFLFSFVIQRWVVINHSYLYHFIAHIIGWIFVLLSLFFGMSGVFRFLRTNNTVETFRSASSLQTTGIYTISRNPMYVGLVCLYTGLSLLIGNWWTIIFIPLFIIILQLYVIQREEIYLQYTFGEQYANYKKKVRRWIGKRKKVSR